jgi:hypothetical protein
MKKTKKVAKCSEKKTKHNDVTSIKKTAHHSSTRSWHIKRIFKKTTTIKRFREEKSNRDFITSHLNNLLNVYCGVQILAADAVNLLLVGEDLLLIGAVFSSTRRERHTGHATLWLNSVFQR